MSLLEQFDRFHEQAAVATGLEDFGTDNYRYPMRLYLEDVDNGGHLGEVGQAITSGMIVGLLSARLITHYGLKQHADSLHAPIKKPIFVIGLTRSGTTALHRLISEDPEVQHLPFWLAGWPKPRPAREEWGADPIFRQVKIDLEAFAATMPGAFDIHPMAADKADECRYLMDQTFWSNTFCTTANVPQYQEWATKCDSRYAYEYYSRGLALIANGDTRRWVLKDPAHLFGLDALLSVFPDACIIHTHRDPFEAVASTANLTYLIRKMREPSLTPREVAQQATALWGGGLNKMELTRRKYDPARFMDLHMLDVRRAPMMCLERIYDRFDQPISGATRAAWESILAADPNLSHQSSRFNVEEYGLERTAVIDAVGAYWGRYQSVLDDFLGSSVKS